MKVTALAQKIDFRIPDRDVGGIRIDLISFLQLFVYQNINLHQLYLSKMCLSCIMHTIKWHDKSNIKLNQLQGQTSLISRSNRKEIKS